LLMIDSVDGIISAPPMPMLARAAIRVTLAFAGVADPDVARECGISRQPVTEQTIFGKESDTALMTRRKILEHPAIIPYINNMNFPNRGNLTGSRVQVPPRTHEGSSPWGHMPRNSVCAYERDTAVRASGSG